MTMTREEYIEWTFKEQEKTLRVNHSKSPVGSQVVFVGSYGKVTWTKGDDGKWTRS
jgi:hypothetical protein